jgi:tetratricopeptide (TPR) repeat protein
MAQRMPVVRQLRWIELIPQFVAIAVLAFVTHMIIPSDETIVDILLAALIYLIFCRTMRAIFVSHHRDGMKAYHDEKFQEAISHFEASYKFFVAHPWLDTTRSLLFGVSSQNSYRIIALCNMAYCYSQAGDGQRAINLYEQALSEKPDCKLAKASLKMLRSVSPASEAQQGA